MRVAKGLALALACALLVGLGAVSQAKAQLSEFENPSTLCYAVTSLPSGGTVSELDTGSAVSVGHSFSRPPLLQFTPPFDAEGSFTFGYEVEEFSEPVPRICCEEECCEDAAECCPKNPEFPTVPLAACAPVEGTVTVGTDSGVVTIEVAGEGCVPEGRGLGCAPGGD